MFLLQLFLLILCILDEVLRHGRDRRGQQTGQPDNPGTPRKKIEMLCLENVAND